MNISQHCVKVNIGLMEYFMLDPFISYLIIKKWRQRLVSLQEFLSGFFAIYMRMFNVTIYVDGKSLSRGCDILYYVFLMLCSVGSINLFLAQCTFNIVM